MSDTDTTTEDREQTAAEHWAAVATDPNERRSGITVLLRMIEVAAHSLSLTGDMPFEEVVTVGAHALYSLGVNLDEATEGVRQLHPEEALDV